MITRAVPLVAALALAAGHGCAQAPAVVGSTEYEAMLDLAPPAPAEIDLLFVIDSSAAMADEQHQLIASAGELFTALEGLPTGLPDLHVGVISTDVGLGDAAADLPGSQCRATGDDGRLHGAATCGVAAGFLTDAPDPDGDRRRNYQGSLTAAFACLADVGTGGCTYAQPLTAIERAVTLDRARPRDQRFLRDDALLVVVLVTDDDDCSVVSAGLFADPDGTIVSPLGPLTDFRCFEFGVECDDRNPRAPGAKQGCRPRDDARYLRRVDDVVHALQDGRPDPSRVLIGGLFGAPGPVTVTSGDRSPQWPQGVPSLAPTCGPMAPAAPAIRLHAFARGFAARHLAPASCSVDLPARLRHIGAAALDVLGGGRCLIGQPARPLTCEALAVAPGGGRLELPVCDGPGCVRIVDDPACTFTEHQLAVRYDPAMVPAGYRLRLDCLAVP